MIKRICLILVASSAAFVAHSQQVVGQQPEKIAAPRSSTPSPLLFTFLINQAGFDTEVTLSNTSADTSGSAQQSGTCTVSYFDGTGLNAPQTSLPIAPGKQLLFTLSQGGGGIAATPGFLGYVIANCTFPLARGTARVYSPNNGFFLATAYDAQLLTLPRSAANPTFLLLPFATNQNGFDTILSIANTSRDPFGTASSSGTCQMSFFGANAPASVLTPIISTGSSYINLLSAVAPAFQGYVVARCNFADASAYAIVSDAGGRNVFFSEPSELLASPRDTTPRPLLFPFLQTSFGVENEVTIANTSSDPLGTTPMAGSCVLSFFGDNAPSPFTTPNIPAGSVYTTLLSPVAPNFFGYSTAACSFPDARGFALQGTDGSFPFRHDGDSVIAEILTVPRNAATTPLLFSTVSNQNNVDTRFVISNTTSDPFGTTSASGACTISYFGDMVGGGSVPSPQTSASIPAGGHLNFSISGDDPAQGIAGAPGFRGYVIADCGFPLARGVSATLALPNLTATNTDNVGGAIALGKNFTWTINIQNNSFVSAGFGAGQNMLVDNLPDSGITYGTATVTNLNNVTGTINCGITANNLTCIATTGVSMGLNGSFQVQFTATPTASGTFANPRPGGSCEVNPNDSPQESDITNNSCGDTVTVAPTIQCTGCYFVTNGLRATLAFNIGLAGPGSTFTYNYRSSTQTVQFVSTSASPGGINGGTATFFGQGNLNGQPGYLFSVVARDGGPAGSGLDAVNVLITGPNNFSYTASGTIAGGDIVLKL